MTSNKEDMLYVDYNDYDYVTREFKESIEYKYDEDSLEEVIKYMRTLSHDMKKDDDIIRKFFRLLRNDDVYIQGTTPKYCKYINLWLNKEYLKEHNQNKVKNFDVFKIFVRKLNEVKYGHKNKSCEKYINPLETKTINKIEFLYDLYDKYNKIKSLSPEVRVKGCDKLDFLSYNYRRSIYNYYFEDQDLYNKLEYIIGEIDKKTGIKNSPCKQEINFTKPPHLVKLLEDKVRQEAEEAEAQKAKEEEARQAKEEEAKKLLMEKNLERPDILSRSPDTELHGMRHENMESQPTSYQAGSQEFVTTRLYSQGERFDSSEWGESPTGSLLEKGYTPGRPTEYTLEGREQQSGLDQEQGDKGTTRPGTSFGSSGFPGYITDVFRSVEPAPILGVSGGMGALFLLFKYTPVGSFFGGRRGRFRQIPRTFNGPFPGDFPNFNEYEGGYIGYGPMNINPLAE